MFQAWLSDDAVTLDIPDDLAGFEGALQAIAAIKTVRFQRGSSVVVLEKGANPKAQGRVSDQIMTWFLVADPLTVNAESHHRVVMATIMAIKLSDRCQVGIDNHHWATVDYTQEIVAKLRNAYHLSDTLAPARAGAEVAVPGRPELKSHKRARQRLRAGEDEQAVRDDWRKDYEDETGEAPENTTSGERELWRNVKRGKNRRE